MTNEELAEIQAIREATECQERLIAYVDEMVRRARLRGASWSDIGEAGGMTAQAAEVRWS